MKNKLEKILNEFMIVDFKIRNFKSTETLRVYVEGVISFEPIDFMVGIFDYGDFEKGAEIFLKESVEMLKHSIDINTNIKKPKIIKITN